MDQDVLTNIEIDRPRSEVADYVSDPENATEWSQSISKAEWTSPKPLSAGSEFAFEARFMDRTREYTYHDMASALEIDNRQDLARLKSILEDGGS